MNSQPTIVCRNVTKRFGNLVAVDGVSLEVQPGICAMDIRFGFAQIFLATAVAFAASQADTWVIGTAILGYVASLLIGGWYWDKSSF